MQLIEVKLANGVVYSIFAEMIMHYSSYFRARLGNDTPQSRSLEVKLTDPFWAPVFGFVVKWMTNGRSLKSTVVYPPVVTYINDGLKYEDYFSPTVQQCVDIWLLADYLGMPEFQVGLYRNLLPLTLAGEWSLTNHEAPELRTT